ncbi:MAG: hypothetical protein WB808_05940 [Candidatus Dormiibacterota bacterium]
MRPVRGWGVRGAAVAVLIVVASCGSESTDVSTADPLHELITLDQLVAPGFTVLSPAMHLGAATLAGGDAAVESALTAGGLQSAASVEFQRTVDFGTSNGPIDVVATVERFAGTGGASTAYSASVRRLDAVQGAVPTSTGPLGDEAHSISVVRTAPDGLQAVEITVVWRVANLVNIIIARGRYGGTRLADALVLAGVQTQNESAIGSA